MSKKIIASLTFIFLLISAQAVFAEEIVCPGDIHVVDHDNLFLLDAPGTHGFESALIHGLIFSCTYANNLSFFLRIDPKKYNYSTCKFSHNETSCNGSGVLDCKLYCDLK